MRSARFLKMVQTNFGNGFLYHLSEPYYGSHHLFITQDYLVYQCNAKGEVSLTVPWITEESDSIPEVLTDLGYMVAT